MISCIHEGNRLHQSEHRKTGGFRRFARTQSEKVCAMAVVQGAHLKEIIVDAGESAKSLNRPGVARLLSLVDAGAVDAVIVAKLDRLTAA
jgi:DNA invertase Pin-like site-specific DNA recombinase